MNERDGGPRAMRHPSKPSAVRREAPRKALAFERERTGALRRSGPGASLCRSPRPAAHRENPSTVRAGEETVHKIGLACGFTAQS